MSQIVCRNVSLGHDSKIIVENLSFSVKEGDYLCIVGENGAGKSTLIRTILKLNQPICGEIILGDDVEQGQIGYLPQQTQVQKDFPASVREIVLSGCLNRCGVRPFFNKSEKRLADECIKKLGIAQLKNQSYRELSGGQQRRALLARALCSAGKIILLDEPAAGLDPVATSEMYSLIGEINKNDKITVVMVSHDILAAVKTAKHILHLGHKEVFFGTTEEYLKSNIAKVFLDTMNGGNEK